MKENEAVRKAMIEEIEACSLGINVEPIEKIKVTKADIIVKGTFEVPYYVLQYREVGKDEDCEGYGSYGLRQVFIWRDDNLEIITEE